MIFDFLFPDIGEGVHEGVLLQWRCRPGDSVQEGDILAEVETDKVVAEIPSPKSGTLISQAVTEGGVIKVGAVMARIELSAEESSSTSASVVGHLDEADETLLPPSSEGQMSRSETPVKDLKENPVPKVMATPVARKLAAWNGIDLSQLEGSGPAGRVLKEDVLKEVSGNGNRSAHKTPSTGTPGQLQPLSTLRKTLAQNMEKSRQIPTAVVHEFAVIDELVNLRAKFKVEETPPSYLALFIKVAALELKSYPLLNSAFYPDKQAYTVSEQINIGFAMDTPEGLVVPVVHRADSLSVAEIQQQIDQRRREVAQRSLELEHLRGGTFTISNYGSIGGTFGVPMILPPQVAVLGIGRIVQEPVVKDGAVAVGQVLPLSLVFDHRPMDGAYPIRFLNAFINDLAQPYRLLSILK